METSIEEGSSPQGFEGLGLKPALQQALTALGYEEPTPIQRAAIPVLLQGRDVQGQAATGTGKTAAFALPLVNSLEPEKCGPFETAALILVPTRELAIQVAEAVYSYGRSLGIGVLPVYGGQEFSEQVRRLKRGVDLVVATPGRALDHLRRKTLKLDKVRTVVLDEADEMLDLGFAEDLEAILSELPEAHQTALFSATLPPRIVSLAERHLKDPVRIQIAREKPVAGELPKVRQVAFIVARAQKSAALRRVLDAEGVRSAIVFCRTRLEVDELTDSLQASGFRAEPLHGGMTQEQRERVLKRFRAQKAELLIATDVAARGLHIEKLSHVINYDLPTAPEAYVHRIGRTGRAGREGVAVSFAEPRERRLLATIERVTRMKIEIAPLPTLADLEARKLDQTRVAVREAVEAGGLEAYRAVVEQLGSEFQPQDVAAAALKLAHAATTRPTADETSAVDLPEWDAPSHRPEKASRPGRGEWLTRNKPEAAKSIGERVESAWSRHEHAGAAPVGPRLERVSESRRERPASTRPPPFGGKKGRQGSGGTVTLFVGLGSQAGVRPADIVGAIANEAGLPSKQVGAIEISARGTTVEVPEEAASAVIEALRATTIRGRRVPVDRDRSQSGPGDAPFRKGPKRY